MRLIIGLTLYMLTFCLNGQSLDLNFKSDNLISTSSGVDGLLINGLKAKYFFTPKENIGFSLGYSYYAKNEIASTKYSGNQYNFGISFQKKWEVDERLVYFLQFNSSVLYSDLNKEFSTTNIAINRAWGSEFGLLSGIQIKVYDEFDEYTGYSIMIGSGLLRSDFIRNEFIVNGITVNSSHSTYEKSFYWNIPIMLGFSKSINGSN